MLACVKFQFTQPKRAATRMYKTDLRTHAFQFTQPKRAATMTQQSESLFTPVSIHAAQAGCDVGAKCARRSGKRFNSRSPSGLRLNLDPKNVAAITVSIHAAQAGCDKRILRRVQCVVRFNSRSPSGLRQKATAIYLFAPEFQFTQPKRAATVGRGELKK